MPTILMYLFLLTFFNNFLKSFVRDKGQKAFIATQAPVEYTIDKFWQMIWENKT
jgi:protein tyrosine phosphatase